MMKTKLIWLIVVITFLVFCIGSLMPTGMAVAKVKEITILVGGGPHLLSPRRAADIYEKKTGIKVNIVESPHKDLYVKAMTDFISGGQSYDAFQFSYPVLATFVAAGFVQPIDKQIKKFGAADEFNDIIPAIREMYGRWDGKTYAVVCDGDTHSYYYRKDLFEDRRIKNDFKRKFGYELHPARTWDEYVDISKFFYETNYVKYGNSELAQRGRMYYWWANRFLAYGGEWFDARGRPAINSAAGIKAANNFKESLKYSPPGVLNFEFSEHHEAWLSGSIPHFVQWGDGWLDGQLSDASKVKGKIGMSLPPGDVVLLAGGWAFAFPAGSKKVDEAFEYIRTIVFGENSVWAMTNPGTGYQPYLVNEHFKNPKVVKALGNEFLDPYMDCMAKGKPLLRIPYAAEFDDYLDLKLSQAMAGEISTKVAMDDVAKYWVELMERYFGSSTLPEKFKPMLKVPE